MTVLSKYDRSPKWTMRSRSSGAELTGGMPNWTPAPGAYDETPPEISKYKGAPKFGFGTGLRFSEHQRPNEKPGPGQYNPSDPILQASKSTGFGTSLRPSIGSSLHGVRAPGPGSYDMNSLVGRGGPMFTARGRRGFGRRSLSSPGPGTYNIRSLLEKGPKAGFGSSTRGDENKRLEKKGGSPGPGAYDMNLYRAFGQDVPKFSLTSRRTNVDLNSIMTPGPGQYKQEPTFGY